jgi:hypothetical protein
LMLGLSGHRKALAHIKPQPKLAIAEVVFCRVNRPVFPLSCLCLHLASGPSSHSPHPGSPSKVCIRSGSSPTANEPSGWNTMARGGRWLGALTDPSAARKCRSLMCVAASSLWHGEAGWHVQVLPAQLGQVGARAQSLYLRMLPEEEPSSRSPSRGAAPMLRRVCLPCVSICGTVDATVAAVDHLSTEPGLSASAVGASVSITEQQYSAVPKGAMGC